MLLCDHELKGLPMYPEPILDRPGINFSQQSRIAIARWVADDNATRPQSALGYPTASAYAAKPTAMDDRPADHANEIGGRHQPVTLSEAGKLCLRAVQRWGSDHVRNVSFY